RYLGQIAVIAKSYARLGWQNLVNFGVLPLEFIRKDDYDTIDESDVVKFENLVDAIGSKSPIVATNQTKQLTYQLTHSMSERQVKVMLVGGVINCFQMPSSHPENTIVMSDF